MSRKEQPELVTSGPYAHIRHPIYTGLILAMLGSAIGVNDSWALLLVPGEHGCFSTRLNVASNRANDGTGMYRLGRLATDGVM